MPFATKEQKYEYNKKYYKKNRKQILKDKKTYYLDVIKPKNQTN